MSATQRLTDLFASLPQGDVHRAQDGRIKTAQTHLVERISGPINNPRDWLEQYLIPVRSQPLAMMGGALAMFRQYVRHGHGPGVVEHVDAEVWIPNGTDINESTGRWSVWHEIGHAMDQVQTTPEGKMIATPDGVFSTKYYEVLREHQERIVVWTPHSNREYKTKPSELWAESVACSVCQPGKMPPRLYDAIVHDLQGRNIPVFEYPDRRAGMSSDGDVPASRRNISRSQFL